MLVFVLNLFVVNIFVVQRQMTFPVAVLTKSTFVNKRLQIMTKHLWCFGRLTYFQLIEQYIISPAEEQHPTSRRKTALVSVFSVCLKCVTPKMCFSAIFPPTVFLTTQSITKHKNMI